MLDKAKTPKRKRSVEGGTEVGTVEQQIVRQLADKRITELNESLAVIKEEHSSLIKEIEMLENGELDSKLPEMWNEIQAELSIKQPTGKAELPEMNTCPQQSHTPENSAPLKQKKTIFPVQHTASDKTSCVPLASTEKAKLQISKNESCGFDTKSLTNQSLVASSAQHKSSEELTAKFPPTDVELKSLESVPLSSGDVKVSPVKIVASSKEDSISNNRPMHTPLPSTQSTLQQLSSDVHLIVQQPNTAITGSKKESHSSSSARAVSSLKPVSSPSVQVALGSLLSNTSDSHPTTVTLATVQVAPAVVQQPSTAPVLHHTTSSTSAVVMSPPIDCSQPSVKLDQTSTNMPGSDSTQSTTPLVISPHPAVSVASNTTSSSSTVNSSQPNTNDKGNIVSSISPTETVGDVSCSDEEKPAPSETIVVSKEDEVTNTPCPLKDEISQSLHASPNRKESQSSEVTVEPDLISDTAECESKHASAPPQSMHVEETLSNVKEVHSPQVATLKETSDDVVALLIQSDSNKNTSVHGEIETTSITSMPENVGVQSVGLDTLPSETSTATDFEPEMVVLDSVPPSIESSQSQSQEMKTEEEVEVEEETTMAKSHKKSERVLRKHLPRKRRLIDDEGPSVESTDTEEEPISTRTSAAPSPAPSQSDMDPEAVQARKQWRKAIMLVWRHAAQHKYANLFLHPVREEDAPGYRDVILRPMDLNTIKRKVESGVIKTDVEFQRDMLLMFQNAFMYNSSDHDVFFMAQEMKNDVMESIQDYLATQAQLQLMESHHTPQQKTLRSREGRIREIHDEGIFSPAKKRKTRADD